MYFEQNLLKLVLLKVWTPNELEKYIIIEILQIYHHRRMIRKLLKVS